MGVLEDLSLANYSRVSKIQVPFIGTQNFSLRFPIVKILTLLSLAIIPSCALQELKVSAPSGLNYYEKDSMQDTSLSHLDSLTY